MGVSLKKIIGQLYRCYDTVAQCSSSRVEARVTTDCYESDRIRSCFFKFSTGLPSRPAALLYPLSVRRTSNAVNDPCLGEIRGTQPLSVTLAEDVQAIREWANA